jgi:hypothetical protein
MATGKIVQIIGAVVDVEFPRDQLPNIYNAITIDHNQDGVNVRLTGEGFHAYVGYLYAQRKMINAVRSSIPVEDVGVLLSSLKALNGFFSEKMEKLK